MEISQNLKLNLASNNKAVKLEYNKIQKPSNFFRGENINNDKLPKKLSYDKTEKFYTSRIKENEIEPKLLLGKLPQAFHFKNNQNSNDSKTTTQTKKSSNEQKNNYNKLSLDYSDPSPDYKNEHEINNYKQKKRSEERKKINNFFIEEEINIQKRLQMKRNNTQNEKHNNGIIPLKIVTKNNNEYLDIEKSSTNYNKNIFIYNIGNNNNNNHVKTDLSEYDGLRPKNNIIDLGYSQKNNNIKNYTFNTSMKDKLKLSEKILTEKKYNMNNDKVRNIFNEALNISELHKNNHRKSSDSDIYPKKISYMGNVMKKNERSGSCMNMVNYQHFNQLDIDYSPNPTNNNTITNNKFRHEENRNDKLRLSAKPILHPIIPYRKNSNEDEKPKFIDNNIKKIKTKTMGKITKMSIITDNLLNKINLEKKINKKNILQKIKNKKQDIENINEGITYKLKNGFKYYFNLRNVCIYFLKEVQYNLAKGIATSIKSWNQIYNENNNYLNIICRKLNTPENHYTFILEYPIGGENLYDIVNSIGLTEPKLIYFIISEIYKNILKLKEENNEIIKECQNIPFCLCNLFLTLNEELKIIPPIIRKIPINASKGTNNDKNKKENISYYNICECKKNLELLMKEVNLPKKNISFFCLGLSILQIITNNFLFHLNSFNTLIKHRNNYSCCLIHSLKFIEEKKCDSEKDLLLLNFLSRYDNKLIYFIHQCTKFQEFEENPNSDFIDCYYMMDKQLDLSMKELYKIITLNNNNYISLDNFLKNFKLLFNDMKIDKNNFKSLLNENKVLDVIRRSFSIDKNQLKNKIYNIIDNNEFNDDLYETNFYEKYVNSGNYFFNASLKQIEKQNKKIMTIINDNPNKENKKNSFNFNKNHIIFKNYNSSENNV